MNAKPDFPGIAVATAAIRATALIFVYVAGTVSSPRQRVSIVGPAWPRAELRG